MRYAKLRKGSWYYERAVPVRLKVLVKKAVVTIPVELKAGVPDSLLAAKIAEIDEGVTLYWKALEASQEYPLDEIDRIKAAKALLAEQKLKPGDAVKPRNLTKAQEEEWGDYEFEVTSRVVDSSRGYLNKPFHELTELEHIEDYAIELLKEPKFKQEKQYRFSDAFDFWKLNNKGKSSYNLDRFLEFSGDEIITTQSLHEGQKKFVEALQVKNESIGSQTLHRYLAEIVSAFKAYADEFQLDVSVKKYKVKYKTEEKQRYSATIQDQIETYKLALDTSLSPELRLLYLLLCQSSVILSEVFRAKPEDFRTSSEGVGYLLIKEQTKTESRKRPVPIVVGTELMEELIAETKDDELMFSSLGRLKDPNKRVNKPLKSINPELTSYSFRHGWLDRAFNNDIPEEFQDRVGGWGASNKTAKRGYAKNADITDDRLKQYEKYQNRINKELLRFASEKTNVVYIGRK